MDYESRMRSAGNSLTEYVLPTVILGTALVAALSTSDLYNVMGNYFASTTNGSNMGSTVVVKEFGSPVIPGAAYNLPPAGAGEESMCFESGLCFNVPTYYGEGSETSGALGGAAINALADMLDNFAAGLADAGEDPALIDLIVQLANQGHAIGNEHLSMESYCPFGTTCTIDAGDWAAVQGIHDNIQGPMKADFQTKWNNLQSYMDSHGSMFVESRSIVDGQAQGINNILNGLNLDGAASEVSNPEAGINVSANTICAVGTSSVCLRRESGGEWVAIEEEPPAP